MRFISPIISLLLIPSVAVLPLPIRAELVTTEATGATSKANIAATTPGQTNLLKIRLADESQMVVQANSFIRGYAILVTDASGVPVPDAAVAIRLPDDGATGFFVNGEHSAVSYTDASGVAKFPQVNWGGIPGTVSIRVTAVKGELHAGALLEQTVTTQVPTQTPTQIPTGPTPASVPAPLPTAIESLPPSAATSAKPASTTPKTPGVPTSVAAVHSGAAPDKTATAPQPVAVGSTEPVVSVVNTAGSPGSKGGISKKWIILAGVLAGVGAGAAVALAGKGGAAAATPASATTTIGTPTISLGH